jgi:hypothetical protein|tara:strand:- start:1118 stop:1273 length:156 start_codon:yes stop_codon:yes gene_type:complete
MEKEWNDRLDHWTELCEYVEVPQVEFDEEEGYPEGYWDLFDDDDDYFFEKS